MHTPKEHLSFAQHNEELASYLEGASYEGWRATALFYAALHYIQFYFVSDIPRKSFSSHSKRDTAIAGESRLDKIARDYRSLQDWSQRCRYDGVKPSDDDFKKDIVPSLERIKKHINGIFKFL